MPIKKNFDEKEILQELKQPSMQSTAFSKIVRQYSEPLYWHIRRMVLSHDDTNDLMQNTFIKAWSSIDTFRGDSQLSTWLYRIAINETLTFLNKRKQTIPIDSPEASVVEQLESDTYFNGEQTKYKC